ncbi:SAV_2336 N-terminal domain-related protein [Streptomyces sp. TLI_146]|uniref:SAV_2336 N-terminal domain-related protein n=1 Tax=Streptomyces sp. TLI_146 TaxID=1938858 RepID=UPI000C712775|nr:SAV_2336 N-terminal domain-related protein [Streptomyces sp. TLI_146]PKV88610.1 serine/threonine protein kinase [Streptomyces sp. TLI_146]
MSSEPAGQRHLADRLRRVLAAAGGRAPTGRELAEALWLAQHMRPEPEVHSGGLDRRLPDRRPEPAVEGPGPEPEAPEPDPPVRAEEPDRVPLRTPPPPAPAPEPGGKHAPLLAPAPAMLAHPLALQRAVRPLKRRVPSAYERELDETATAHRGALAGDRPEWWFPVLRPRPERWLHLRIVFDAGPTMAMWRPLLRDLHRALAQTGAFRTVEVLPLAADGGLPARPAATSRTAVLVLSDCMGPQWRDGPAGRRWYRTLRGWARTLPVAVVQPLPERLWQYTAFAPAAGLLSAPGPGAAGASLTFLPYESDVAATVPGGIPVPVLEPAARWLRNWAELVGARGGTQVPGAAAVLGGRPPCAETAAPVLDLPPDELVLRFRSVASPAAFRLAAHLAVGCAHLPVMRLVHAAVEPHPQPQHLAEVVLSGMLTAVPGPPGAYDFRPGVREVLLGTLPHTAHVRTSGLLSRVNARIEAMAGAVPGEFRALVAARGGPVGAVPGDPFALVSRESVRLLRGPEEVGGGRVLEGRYELRERIGPRPPGEVWRARELTLRQMVAVTLYRLPTDGRSAPTHGFLARAREVAAIHHPHLLLNFDAFATEDAWCLVTELVEAPTLDEAMARHPDGWPVEDVLQTGRELLSALDALHEEGIVHGSVRAENVLLSAERGALLCDPGVRHDPGPRLEDDLLEAGRLLFRMAVGTRSAATESTTPEAAPRAALAHLPSDLASTILGLLDGSRRARSRAAADLLSSPSTTRRVYRLLGPPEAWVNGIPAPDSDGPELRMLCALVLAQGDRIAGTELWEPNWRDDVRDVANRLRLLGHPVVGTADETYRMTLKGADIDLLSAEQLVFQAEAAESSGERSLALDRYERALGLWAGDPLEGMPGEWAARHRGELAELLRMVRERRDLLRIVSSHPLVVVEVLPDSALRPVPASLLTAVEAVFGVAPEAAEPYGAATRLLVRPAAPPLAVLEQIVEELPARLIRDMPRTELESVRLRVLVDPDGQYSRAKFVIGIPPTPADTARAGVVDVCVPDALHRMLDARGAEEYERFEEAGHIVWFRRIEPPSGRRITFQFPLPSAVDGLAFTARADVAWWLLDSPAAVDEVRRWLSDELAPLVREHGLAQLDLAQVRVDARLSKPQSLGQGGGDFLARVTLHPSLTPLRTLLAPVRTVLVDHDGTLSRPHAQEAIRALVASGRRVVVVTGGDAEAVERVLGDAAGDLAGIRARTQMGEDAILQAVGTVADALVVGRMPGAAASAARLGVPYIGLADGAASAADLRAAGATLVTTSLGAITDALQDG